MPSHVKEAVPIVVVGSSIVIVAEVEEHPFTLTVSSYVPADRFCILKLLLYAAPLNFHA